MSNYDHDVIGVGNFEHPANSEEDNSIMTFDQAMDSLTDEQREAIEGELIDREAAYKRKLKKLNKAKELMQAIVEADEVMNESVIHSWGSDNTKNKSKWNDAYYTKVIKQEQLKKLLLEL